MSKKKKKIFTDARKVIKKFGGIRPMASKMDVPATTVQGWKKRNSIPVSRQQAVLKAAEEYDISLDDLIKSGANEKSGTNKNNSNKPSDQNSKQKDTIKSSTAAEDKETTIKGTAQDKSDFQKTVESSAENIKTPDQDPLEPTLHESLMGKITEAERRAVQKSSLITAFLVLLVVGAGAILLWPTHETVTQNTDRLTDLETDITELQEQKTFLQKILPDRFEEDIAQLRDRAQKLQSQMARLTEQADTFNTEVIGPDAGTLIQRMERLEDIVEELTGSSDLSALLNRVKNLQQSVEGQEQLSRAIEELNKIVGNMQGRMDELDSSLAEAKTENDALGQTLQGVSPTDLKAAAMLVGLAQFRASLNRNTPFAEDLELMQNIVGEDNPALLAAIERLAPKAEEGVLSPEGLSQQLRGLTGELVVSSLKGEDITIKEQAKARLSEVLQVEKDGEPLTGTDAQKAIARAQNALDEGNIRAAIIELESLEGPAASKAQPLVQEAEKTLLARQVETMLTESVLQQIQSSGTGKGSMSLKSILKELENLGGDVPPLKFPNKGSEGQLYVPQ